MYMYVVGVSHGVRQGSVTSQRLAERLNAKRLNAESLNAKRLNANRPTLS